jgi:hypothetical protein
VLRFGFAASSAFNQHDVADSRHPDRMVMRSAGGEDILRKERGAWHRELRKETLGES